MNKSEFIERLCSALSGSGTAGLVEKNRIYYTEYIDGEMAKGRSEEEILAELGEPELIANSILEANGLRDRFVDDDTRTYNAYDTPDGDPTTFAQGTEYRGKGSDRDGADGSGMTGGNTGTSGKGMSPKTKLIIILVAAALFVIGIIVLFIAVIGGIFALLGPILIPVICIWLIYKLIKSISGK